MIVRHAPISVFSISDLLSAAIDDVGVVQTPSIGSGLRSDNAESEADSKCKKHY